jgi:hypothetical protein
MTINTDNLGDTIAALLPYADPAGRNYARLIQYQNDVRRNVMLGPTARRFIHDLVAKLDNIECNGLSHRDLCGQPRCTYTDRYDACPKYKPVKPYVKGGLM